MSAGRVWVWGVAYWLILAPVILLRPPQISGNTSSRYMTIEAIAERGTLAIERSPLLAQSGSPDVVRFGKHSYSDKPPVLPALASPIYLGLLSAGIRFTGSIGQYILCNFTLTWLITTLASAGCLVALRAMLQAVAMPAWAADLSTITLGITSPLLTYAVAFNNHSVAAGCVTIAWALVLLERSGGRVGWNRSGAGLLAGLAAVIDLPIGGVTLAGLGVIELGRGGRALMSFSSGALGPLLLHAGLQSLVTGSPLPAEMYPTAFEYPGSYWLTPEGNWQDPRPRWKFGLDFLIGRQGATTVWPLFWLGLFGLGGAIFGPRARPRGERPASVILTGSLVILILYYVWLVRRTDFAGGSYGVRHLLAIEPMLGLFAFMATSWLRPRWLAIALLIVATIVGGIYSVAGAVEPWSRVESRAPTNTWLRFLQHGVLYPYGTYRGEFPATTPPPNQKIR